MTCRLPTLEVPRVHVLGADQKRKVDSGDEIAG